MPPIGHRIIRLEEATSTIDIARALAEEGAEHGTVVIADRQTSGRGRRGRAWTTIPGKSLAMTAILRELPEPERLGLAGMTAAVAVVRAVKGALGLSLRTKWPNDVVVGRESVTGTDLRRTSFRRSVPVTHLRKLVGTLAELHRDALLLSLGLNINGTEVDLPEDLRETATTLEMVLGIRGHDPNSVRPNWVMSPNSLHREEVTARVLGELDECWRRLIAAPDDLLAEWEALDVTRGEEVVVADAGGPKLAGRALGTDAQGRLRVLTAEGQEVALEAGEVTLA